MAMIGIAVCGAGSWGKNLVRNFAMQSEARLEYVVDLSEKTRAAMAKLYPQAKVTAELADALNDPQVQGVVVAVEAQRHFNVAKRALEAGKHTFVEKPLTLTAADSEELIRLAEARGLKLMVGHILRHHPAVAYMRRMVADGEISPLYLYTQRVNLGVVRREDNAWWSLAPHDVSIACDLLDAEPVSVSVCGQSYLQPGVEDVCFATVRFAGGRIAHIHVSWLDPHKIRKVTLVGAKKMVVFDDMDAQEKIRIYDKGAEVKEDVDDFAEAITLRIGDIHIPKVASQEPLSLECSHFLEAIRNDTTPLSDGYDGLRVVKVLEAGARSLSLGGAPVEIARSPM
jgi:predicted dehydrogenase